ncbi:hypothetical protein ABH922_004328 [Rhodococcus sp. 27YEA15]|uniref:hypothetical protein n=1 Tax=Rhodococcus sp. 27YEA15 TaxID=3156259 RepID=UPI003C7AC017
MSALLAIAVFTGCSSPDSDAADVPAGPPPSAGMTEDRSESITTLPPVPVDQPSTLSNDLEVTAVGTEPLELSANGPGEIGGSGLSVTLEFVNTGTTDISLDDLTVNAYYNEGLPASPGSAETAAPVGGILAPGDRAQGVYLFQIPEDGLDSTVFEVSHSDSENVIAVAR